MAHNFVSLKSRFQNAQGVSTRAGDAPAAARELHLKTTSSHTQPANRVEKMTMKTTANGKKRRSQNEVTLTDHFKSTIQTYRVELDYETDRLLSQTETDLDNHLAHITEEFGGQLQLVAEYENNIFQPISEDRLEITSSSPDKNDAPQKQQVTLADRMRDFEQVVSTEAAHLETLWKEWHAASLDLACLAVEVLGPDGVKLAFNTDNQNTATHVTAAIDAHRARLATRAAVNERAAELESSIRRTAEETISNLNQQEKEWRIIEKRKIQKIKQIMMEGE